jgi:hypothetical protein
MIFDLHTQGSPMTASATLQLISPSTSTPNAGVPRRVVVGYCFFGRVRFR